MKFRIKNFRNGYSWLNQILYSICLKKNNSNNNNKITKRNLEEKEIE